MFRESRSSLPQYFISPKIEIKKSPIHGIGVFAKEEIKRLTMVESSPVIVFTEATCNHLWELNDWRHVLMDYPFHWEEGYLAFCLGYGGVYNHSSLESNIAWNVNHQLEVIEFTAQRNIEPGEELLIMYCPVAYAVDKLWFVSDLDEEEDRRAERGERLQHQGGVWDRYDNSSTDLFERLVNGIPPVSGTIDWSR